MNRPKVTGVISTLRSTIPQDELYAVVNSVTSYDDLTEYIYKAGGNQSLCNSEALLMSGLFGAREIGCQIQLINLKQYPSLHSDGVEQKKILSFFRESSGLLLSSPVYFGDRSSLLNNFLKLIEEQDADDQLPMKNKGVGLVSVGAKRNGGQETTNIYALADCFKMGACIVGNGPPTSQYGGTGFGGAIGGIIDDHYGLNSAKGTGHRVGVLSRLFCLEGSHQKISILILITKKDQENKFQEFLYNLPFSENVVLEIIDINDYHIKPCRACRICPAGNLRDEYTCVIRNNSKSSTDQMQIIHEKLVKADGIIIANYAAENSKNEQFQKFMERTRFIRRNDFELTDKVLSMVNITRSMSDLSWLRELTSFLRHNLFISGPSYMRLENAKSGFAMENISTKSFVTGFEIIVRKAIVAGHMKINTIQSKYTPIGYPEN